MQCPLGSGHATKDGGVPLDRSSSSRGSANTGSFMRTVGAICVASAYPARPVRDSNRHRPGEAYTKQGQHLTRGDVDVSRFEPHRSMPHAQRLCLVRRIPSPHKGADAAAKSKKVQVNGTTLHYLEWGREQSPPLMLLHERRNCFRGPEAMDGVRNHRNRLSHGSVSCEKRIGWVFGRFPQLARPDGCMTRQRCGSIRLSNVRS